MKLTLISLPLPWREGIKGRGITPTLTVRLSSRPKPSPVKGEGILDGKVFYEENHLGYWRQPKR